MDRQIRVRIACTIALLAAACASAQAQERKYPSRPVDMIVNFGPGGGADQLGRIMSKLLEPVLGVPVPVSNIAGASGNAGLSKVLGSTPDGYTLGTLTGLSVSAWAGGLGKLQIRDFAFIAVVQSSPSMLFVPNDSRILDYRRMLDAAKANPGKLRVATAGYGTLDDIAVKFLATKGFPMVNVPFAKPGERYMSPLGGHSEILFEEPGDVVQFIDSKQYRPIVVFGARRHPAFPDTPASGEFGHDVDLPNWRAIVAAAKVPADTLAALNAAVAKALDSPDWRKFCGETYTCIERKSPEESRQFAQRNYDDVSKFMKDYGMIK
ncbi:MAG: tripartite tricarboxylate transporter substrate binding protein [Betaproteobacteria bacterium]|nr:tripartite tricarboxylate transporter substrate binding protein [Betaproteobacteria bacterium]